VELVSSNNVLELPPEARPIHVSCWDAISLLVHVHSHCIYGDQFPRLDQVNILLPKPLAGLGRSSLVLSIGKAGTNGVTSR
jgi:hypothetical protein